MRDRCPDVVRTLSQTDKNHQFRENGLELAFLKADDIIYPQFGEEFVPNLSIIDVMMFNSVPEIQDMLNRYTLVKSLAS